MLAAYSAAGRDRAAHGPDADRFDVTCAGPRPLSLGHGPHYCLGAPLARLEATVAPERLFGRFPELTLAEPEETLPRPPGSSATASGACPSACAEWTAPQDPARAVWSSIARASGSQTAGGSAWPMPGISSSRAAPTTWLRCVAWSGG